MADETAPFRRRIWIVGKGCRRSCAFRIQLLLLWTTWETLTRQSTVNSCGGIIIAARWTSTVRHGLAAGGHQIQKNESGVIKPLKNEMTSFVGKMAKMTCP
jgi:hypothetical protein